MSSSEEERTAAATALDIRSYAARTIRDQYPYMKTDTLEKILDEMQKQCGQKLLEQEPEHQATKSRSSLFSLSGELRNQIYEDVFADAASAGIYVKQYGRQSAIPALLQVSKQVREEAMSLYYNNTIRATIRTSKNSRCTLPQYLQVIGPKQAAMIKTFELRFRVDYRMQARVKEIVRGMRHGAKIRDPKDVEQLLSIYRLLDLGVPLESWSLMICYPQDSDDGLI